MSINLAGRTDIAIYLIYRIEMKLEKNINSVLGQCVYIIYVFIYPKAAINKWVG